MKTLVEQNNKLTEQVTALCQTLAAKGPVEVQVQPAQRNAADVRAERVQQLALNLRKSTRVKVYKPEADVNVYLRKFAEEIKTLKHIAGIDDDLLRGEYVPIFKSNLDFVVIERLEQAFLRDPMNPITWADVTIANLHKLMKAEFG